MVNTTHRPEDPILTAPGLRASAPVCSMRALVSAPNEAWAGQQAGFYYVVVDAMLKTGFTPEEIRKIGGGNFLRIFSATVSEENSGRSTLPGRKIHGSKLFHRIPNSPITDSSRELSRKANRSLPDSPRCVRFWSARVSTVLVLQTPPVEPRRSPDGATKTPYVATATPSG